jgi:3-oxoacyl-[acyl-carrier protein] reductase
VPDGLSPVALVTGASGALGAALARHLSERGFAVGLHAHTGRDRVEELAAALDGPTAVVTADVADAAAVDAAAAEVADALGPVGVLVTCAGIRVDGLLSAQAPDVWARTVAVNLMGTFHACRAVLPAMLRARSGCIVAVTSPTAAQGRSGQTAYGASKAGVTGLVHSLSREVGRRQVRVNAISPGFIESEINASLPHDVVEDLRGRIDLGRFATPEDVLGAVDLLVDSPYITGQVIGLDGGIHL